MYVAKLMRDGIFFFWRLIIESNNIAVNEKTRIGRLFDF